MSQRPGAGAPSALDQGNCYYERQCVVLVDWWLERMDGKICIAGLMETPRMRTEGVFSPQGKKKLAGRVFKDAISMVCDAITVETVEGYVVWLKGNLNKSRMLENGFSREVYKSFKGGFPVQWKNHLDGHSQAPSKPLDEGLVQHYLDKFMSDSFVRSKEFSFEEYNICSYSKFASYDFGEPGTPKCSVSLGTENASEVPAAGITAPSGAGNDFGAPGTPKCSVNLGTENASEVPVAGMTAPSAAVNDFGEPGTPKCSLNLGTENASEVPAAGMTAPSGAGNEVRTLRSGKVFGGPIRAPVTGGRNWKREQHKASNNKKLPNEAVSPSADLTSHDNACTAAGIIAEDKLQSNDLHSRRELRKRIIAKRERKRLFLK